jgi:dephospho-CoA kinase
MIAFLPRRLPSRDISLSWSSIMLVVGLTGGIASGKSTVSRIFEEQGIPVVCADALAHEAVSPGAPALEEIRRAFGDAVIDSEGGLDRVAMATIVFRDPDKRRTLELIIHPSVSEETDRRVTQFQREGHPIVVVDVPLLYESGWERHFDLIIVVYVPRAVQEARLCARDGLSIEAARARLDAQMSIEEKRRRADQIVDNAGELRETKRQVVGIIGALSAQSRLDAGEGLKSG